jgi:hypothetical protein
MLTTELIVAMAIMVLVMIPLAFAFREETILLKAAYHRAVAMEIVDGEMEALVAGGWRGFPAGETRGYPVKAFSATNLPPGEFVLTLGNARAKLEWVPQARNRGGRVTREARLP